MNNNIVQILEQNQDYLTLKSRNSFKNINNAENPHSTKTKVLSTKNGENSICAVDPLFKENQTRILINNSKSTHDETIHDFSAQHNQSVVSSDQQIFFPHTILDDLKLFTKDIILSSDIKLSKTAINEKLYNIKNVESKVHNEFLKARSAVIKNTEQSIDKINSSLYSVMKLNRELNENQQTNFEIFDELKKELTEISQIIEIEVQFNDNGSTKNIFSPLLNDYILTPDYFSSFKIDIANFQSQHPCEIDFGSLEISLNDYNHNSLHSSVLDLNKIKEINSGGNLVALLQAPKISKKIFQEFKDSINLIIEYINKASNQNILHLQSEIQGLKVLEINDPYDLTKDPIEIFLVNHQDGSYYTSDKKNFITQAKITDIWGVKAEETKISHLIEALNYELDFKASNSQVKIKSLELGNEYSINNLVLTKNFPNQNLILEIEGNKLNPVHVKIKSISYKDQMNQEQILDLRENASLKIDVEDSSIINLGSLKDINQTDLNIELAILSKSGEEISVNNVVFNIDDLKSTENQYFSASNQSTGEDLLILQQDVPSIETKFISLNGSDVKGFLNMQIKNSFKKNYSLFVNDSYKFLEKNGFNDLLYRNPLDNFQLEINQDLLSSIEKISILEMKKKDSVDQTISAGYEVKIISNFFYELGNLLEGQALEEQISNSSYKIHYEYSESKKRFEQSIKDLSISLEQNSSEENSLTEINNLMYINHQIYSNHAALRMYYKLQEDFLKTISGY
ncbi:MAG: hypothetical protein ISN64_01730 [Rickettsia sp.]|nr:hypothetical protein [Rickettsia sp.]